MTDIDFPLDPDPGDNGGTPGAQHPRFTDADLARIWEEMQSYSLPDDRAGMQAPLANVEHRNALAGLLEYFGGRDSIEGDVRGSLSSSRWRTFGQLDGRFFKPDTLLVFGLRNLWYRGEVEIEERDGGELRFRLTD